MKSITYLCALLFWVAIANTRGQSNDSGANGTSCCYKNSCCNGNNQSPAGIMTDHIHSKGEWMISYSYMGMTMNGMMSGENKVSKNDVYNAYMMSPGKMVIQQHMVMAMYGITDRFTLMAMGGYQTSNMNMTMSPMVMQGMFMAEQTMYMNCNGLTDTRITGLYNFSKNQTIRAIGSLSAIVPTGECNAMGTNMLGEQQWMPYSMQPGAGSWGVVPGFTLVKMFDKWSCGADMSGEVRFGNNKLGYQNGSVYRISCWGGHKFVKYLNASLRTEYGQQSKITGSSNYSGISFVAPDDPSYDVKNSGRKYLNFYLGANMHTQKQLLSHFDLLLECGFPAYEQANGFQMANQYSITTTIQYSL